MKKNFTLEEVNELVDRLKSKIITDDSNGTYNISAFSDDDLKDFKKDNGLAPTLEAGKWYKGDDQLWFYSETLTNPKDFKGKGYGFSNGIWQETNWNTEWYQGWTPATDEEVKEALIKEATKRGFKEGVKYTSTVYNGTCILSNTGSIGFDGNNFMYLGQYIMSNGKWAEIIEEVKEVTMSEVEAKYGCKVKIVKE